MPTQIYANTGSAYPPIRLDYPQAQPTLVVAPTITLGTLDECKAYLGVEDNSHDSNLALLLAAESNNLEAELDQRLRLQTWLQTFTCFHPVLRLKVAPVTSITSIQYYDSTNVLQTSTDFTLRKYPFPELVLNYAATLPAT